MKKWSFERVQSLGRQTAGGTRTERLLKLFRGRPDLLAASLVMLVVMMMIVPLPQSFVDAAIAFNFAVSILLVAIVTYVPNPLSLSTFPTLLLIITAFRLAISISTTRLVLLEANAGHIVEAFGRFVVGGNAVVGFVMFLILTVVQFLVVTKGAERIAEVAARFSLDSLPGKQLSIDGDVRAGFLDAAEARKRRNELSSESQLFGAMDGAMKFVKGDAVAGLIIVAINMFGGFAVGMLQQGMSASASIQTFVILTVGDGLIAQIPALLVALSCGMLIARVAPAATGGEEGAATIGDEMTRQMLAEPKAWYFSAAVIATMSLIPGLPALLFLGIAAAVAGVALLQVGRTRRKTAGIVTDHQLSKDGLKDLRRIVPNIPLVLRAANRHENDAAFLPLIASTRQIRNAIVAEYGVTLPALVFQFSDLVPDDELHLCIYETPQLRVSFRPGEIAWRLPRGEVIELPAELTDDSSIPAVALREEGWFWAPAVHRQALEERGLVSCDFETFFAERVRATLFEHGAQFLGMQEMRAFIAWLDTEAPELAKEIQRCVPTAKLCSVLQQLARERVPVRNFRLIGETLIASGLHDRDPEVIVDHLRQVLRDEITTQYVDGGIVKLCLLHSALEDALRGSLRQSVMGAYIELPASELDQIYNAILAHVYPNDELKPRAIVVVAQDIRRPLWQGAALMKRFLPTLSYPELSPNYRTEVVARVDWVTEEFV
ncbi:MAG: EscV/YscV/HrcV family type III secretion system export apparatus protein [Variovorax sp.]|jgi:type III secretion protein V|nr:MAG: EscV/YscV/HrcV family type III secretion system export apparatus protein [Variovorax sp.]